MSESITPVYEEAKRLTAEYLDALDANLERDAEAIEDLAERIAYYEANVRQLRWIERRLTAIRRRAANVLVDAIVAEEISFETATLLPDRIIRRALRKMAAKLLQGAPEEPRP